MPAKKKDGDEPTAGGGAAGGATPAQDRGKRTPQGPPPNKGAQIDPGTAALRPSQRGFSCSCTTFSVFSADKPTVKRLQGQLARASKSEDFEDDTGQDKDDEDEDEGHTGEEEDGGVEGSLTAAGDDDDDDLIVVDEQREVVVFFARAEADHKKGAT